jgi:N-acylneuraminate cytidylyltransferase/CMP-N,N'-diacetyllegionaminic acid synthase
MKKNILAIITARGGSKGVPKKNIRLLAGKPLIVYTIEAAQKSKFLNRIIVSTDDQEIAKIAKKYKVEVPFIRPKNLARDTTPMLSVLRHAVKHLEDKEEYEADIIVRLQPTSPLRTAYDIDRAIDKLLKTNASIVETVCKVNHHPFWMVKLKNDKLYPFIKTKKPCFYRQELPELYMLNGAVYVIKKQTLMKKKKIFSENTRAIIMEPERSIDIDNLFNFKIAEFLIKETRRWIK